VGPYPYTNLLVTVVIEAIRAKDIAKVPGILAAIAQEDATFRAWLDEESGQQMIGGTSEVQVDGVVQRVRDEVDVVASKPRVSYRQAITEQAEMRGTSYTLVQGRGHRCDCVLRLRPFNAQERWGGTDIIVIDGTDETLPTQCLDAIKDGVCRELARGSLMPYPTINVHVTVMSASQDDADSSREDFVAAGRNAIDRAYPMLGVAIIEPWMRIAVETPDSCAREITEFLRARRALNLVRAERNQRISINCQAPLSQMLGFASQLSVLSREQATYAMELHGYFAI
jgi:elongation factor G